MTRKKTEIFYLIFIILCEIYWFNGIAYAKMSYVKYITYPFIILAAISYLIYIITSKYSIKEWIILCVGMAVSVYYYIGTVMQFEGILTLIPAIIGMKKINIKKVTKAMCITLTISYVLFILFNVIGLVPWTNAIKTGNDRTEYKMLSLGTQHGNPLYLLFFCILSTYLYSNIDKYSWKHFIILLAITILAYAAFKSRTGFLLSLIMLLGALIVRRIKNLNRVICFLIKFFPFIMVIGVTLLSTTLFDTALAQIMDKVITNRLTCANFYLEHYGVSLLPRYITEYIVFDNMYAFMLVEYGIIFSIIYCLLYTNTLGKLLKNKKYVEVLMILLYGLYAYCEKGFLKIFCNFPMLFIAYLMYDIFKEQNDEKNQIKNKDEEKE